MQYSGLKHNSFFAFTLLAGFILSLALTSCQKEKYNIINPNPREKSRYEGLIVDYSPVIFRVEVTDTDGADLVNPEHPKSISQMNIQMELEGKMYPLQILRQTSLRAYHPHFYGFRCLHNIYSKRWELEFGEFDGGEDKDHIVRLHWEDGKTSELRILVEPSWSLSLGPYQKKRTYYLDGKRLPQSQRIFRFVRS